MKNSKALAATVVIALIIAIGAMAGTAANAATSTVPLGTAASFSVLGGLAVTNTGPTTTDKDVGVWPGTSVGAWPPGIAGGAIHAGDAVAQQAQSDLTTAYNNAAGRTPFTVVGGDLVGQTLVGGVYRGGTLGLTGVLTLDGQNDPASVWIFQTPATLITGSSSLVSFINGASPCNVFWQVGSSATLGTGSTFVGTIMALTKITVTTGVTVYGRALARNDAVTLDNDRFLTSVCASALNIPPTRPPFTVAPSATPIAAPTATPIGAATPTAAPTVAPTAAPTVHLTVLPSTSTAESWGPLALLGLALASFGALLLLRRPLRNF
ncbi:MAG: ice-binding family protein [Chloroflexota bacterium]